MNKKKILLVDDSNISGIVLQALCENYTILFADDFSTTCEHLLEHKEDISLIVFNCAILMPDEWEILIENLIHFHPYIQKIAIAESEEIREKLQTYELNGILKKHFLRATPIKRLISKALKV